MDLYLNELAPWQRKSEYYHNIQLGRDLNEQTRVIKSQSKAMIESQLAAANEIIASQDRIQEGLGQLNVDLENIEQGLKDLKSTFEWGISEIVWQFEQNRMEMKEILEVLMAPLNFQAKERRRRAEEAYVNGWIEDAEFEFNESEKLNRYDFSIHISLGLIHLFHKTDKKEALKNFENAIKYARPKSNYYTSFALLHKSIIMFDLGDTHEAEKCTDEAINLSPDFIEAYYQNAQYNAQLKNIEKSLIYLKHVITEQPLYCLKVNSDPLFDPIRKDVNDLMNKLRVSEGDNAGLFYNALISYNNKLLIFMQRFKNSGFIKNQFLEDLQLLGEGLKDIQKRIERNSYIDYYEVNNIYAPKIEHSHKNLYEGILNSISDIKNEKTKNKKTIVENIQKSKDELNSSIDSLFDTSTTLLLTGSGIVPAILMLIFEDGSGKFLAILFFIPYLSQILSIGLVWMSFFDSRYSNDSDMRIMAWVIIIYLVVSVGMYFYLKAHKKSQFAIFANIQKSKIVEAEKFERDLDEILIKFKNEYELSRRNFIKKIATPDGISLKKTTLLGHRKVDTF